MTHDIVMPQLGLTMEEGSVVCWQKQPGDWVEKGEILFVVETDKSEIEVESPSAGFLNSIRVEVKKKVPVGTVIAILGDQPGEGAAAPATDAVPIATGSTAMEEKTPPAEPMAQESGSAGASAAAQENSTREFASSPRARRLAKELGIDIAAVKPARGERIVEEDVRRFHQLQLEVTSDER